jgi:hypothetical protein
MLDSNPNATRFRGDAAAANGHGLLAHAIGPAAIKQGNRVIIVA